MNTLFDACLKSLGTEGKILPADQENFVNKTLVTLFPFTRWGTIDWLKVEDHIVLNSVSDALLELQKRGNVAHENVFIVWDEATLPTIASDLDVILREIKTVTKVSFDTWIFDPTEKYIIEFHHDNGIRLGFSQNVS